MLDHVHTWHMMHAGETQHFYCECGAYSLQRPDDYVESATQEDDKEDEEDEELGETKCRHVWECLRDRVHNRGKGKYQAYKCKLCQKFQRR